MDFPLASISAQASIKTVISLFFAPSVGSLQNFYLSLDFLVQFVNPFIFLFQPLIFLYYFLLVFSLFLELLSLGLQLFFE